jgi:hypothetical protein
MNTTNRQALPESSHHDLSRQYGCHASMTVATFVLCGIVHRARRLFRADLPGTGKIEVYTIQPYQAGGHLTEFGWYSATTNEDFFCYATPNGTSKLDRAAAMAIAMAEPNTVHDGMTARYAAVEF